MKIETPNKKYKKDKDLVFSCQYHIVFCPKYRRKVLSPEIAQRLKKLIISKQKEYDFNLIEIEVMLDHVHMLIEVNPKKGIYKVISKIKGYTSNKLRTEFPELKSKLPSLWTNARFISTVGSVSLETVKKYIENQKNK